jgi:hypothetical protein
VSTTPYGTIFKVRTCEKKNEKFALRLVAKKSKNIGSSTVQMEEEISNLLEMLDHPNIVKVVHKEAT